MDIRPAKWRDGMKIGQLSELTGLSIDTLRYYEKIGLIDPPFRKGGQRLYDPDAVRWIDFLKALKATGARVAILSNGSVPMLASAVKNAALDTVIDDVFSVDELKTFKTDPAVYDMVTTSYRLYPDAVSFQSSNRWDVAGAAKFGFRTIWINRARMPDEYRDLSPSLILPDLNGVE